MSIDYLRYDKQMLITLYNTIREFQVDCLEIEPQRSDMYYYLDNLLLEIDKKMSDKTSEILEFSGREDLDNLELELDLEELIHKQKYNKCLELEVDGEVRAFKLGDVKISDFEKLFPKEKGDD